MRRLYDRRYGNIQRQQEPTRSKRTSLGVPVTSRLSIPYAFRMPPQLTRSHGTGVPSRLTKGPSQQRASPTLERAARSQHPTLPPHRARGLRGGSRSTPQQARLDPARLAKAPVLTVVQPSHPCVEYIPEPNRSTRQICRRTPQFSGPRVAAHVDDEMTHSHRASDPITHPDGARFPSDFGRVSQQQRTDASTSKGADLASRKRSTAASAISV